MIGNTIAAIHDVTPERGTRQMVIEDTAADETALVEMTAKDMEARTEHIKEGKDDTHRKKDTDMNEEKRKDKDNAQNQSHLCQSSNDSHAKEKKTAAGKKKQTTTSADIHHQPATPTSEPQQHTTPVIYTGGTRAGSTKIINANTNANAGRINKNHEIKTRRDFIERPLTSAQAMAQEKSTGGGTTSKIDLRNKLTSKS